MRNWLNRLTNRWKSVVRGLALAAFVVMRIVWFSHSLVLAAFVVMRIVWFSHSLVLATQGSTQPDPSNLGLREVPPEVPNNIPDNAILTGIAFQFFFLVLPGVVSWRIARRLEAKEYALQQTAQQEGEVFPIPAMARTEVLFVMISPAALCLCMLIAALNGARTHITMRESVGLTLAFSPLIVGGLAFLWNDGGFVTLTATGVTLHRPGRTKSLRYDDIVAVKSLLALSLRGTKTRLRIPRTVSDMPRLYNLLLARVAPAVRAAALNGAAAAAPGRKILPLYAFGISRRVWALYVAGTVLFVLLYLGLGLIMLWTGLARGDVPPFTWRWARDAALFFLLISVVFLPALILVLRSFFTRYGPGKMLQPSAMELYLDQIRYRFPRSSWQERPAADLQRVALESLPVTVMVDKIEQEVTRYMLVLEFSGGDRLVIEQERAAQFGKTPEQLRAVFKKVYRK